MATKQSALAALKAHLAKPVYSEQLSSLHSVRTFVENCYPRLQVEDVHISDNPEAGGSRWVIVCTTKFSDIRDGSGPVKPARMARETIRFRYCESVCRQGRGRHQRLHIERFLVS